MACLKRGSPERGEGAALEALADLDDALCSVGALHVAVIILVEAAEPIIVEAAMCRNSANVHGAMNTWAEWQSALEVCDGAALQPLKQLVDALSGVGATSTRVKAAEGISSETVEQVQEKCKMSQGGEQNGKRAAHLRLVREELGRSAAIATPPSARMPHFSRLSARKVQNVMGR